MIRYHITTDLLIPVFLTPAEILLSIHMLIKANVRFAKIDGRNLSSQIKTNNDFVGNNLLSLSLLSAVFVLVNDRFVTFK